MMETETIIQTIEYPDPYIEKMMSGHRGSITALSFSPKGYQIVTGSLDKTVRIWDKSKGHRCYRFRGHTEAVMDVVYSPSGEYVASASGDNSVRVWFADLSGRIAILNTHTGPVQSVQFNYDELKMVTASDDLTVKLTELRKLQPLSTFNGHTSSVKCARMFENSIIASCAEDKCMKLWSVNSGECVCTIKEEMEHGLHLDWTSSGYYIAVAMSSGQAKIYDVRTQSLVQYYKVHEDVVNRVAFHPTDRYLFTASRDCKVQILDLVQGCTVYTVLSDKKPFNAVNVSSSGKSFATGGDDNLLITWKSRFPDSKDAVKQ